MTTLLVCPPSYYGIEYEINPWMRITNQADPGQAQAQWARLMEVLEKDLGAQLARMNPVKGLPDLVFTANAGLVVEKTAVPSRFRYPERQREEASYEQWFREQGFTIELLDRDCFFEGAGDLLRFPDAWYGGYRQRSDIRAYGPLGEIFGKEIVPLELVNPQFYHLDTCFCPLSGGELLYFPPAFDPYAQKAIAHRIDETRRLTVPEEEALRFACNAVCIGRRVALPTGCPETVRLLESRGYEAFPIDLAEFMKAGGSAKCLTLALD